MSKSFNKRWDQLLREIWQKVQIEAGYPLKDYLFTINNSMIDGSKEIKLSFDVFKDAAYTHLQKDRLTRRIMLGGQLIKNICGLPDRFTSKAKVKEYFSEILMTFIGLDYHEMAHNLFTDMVSTKIANYPKFIYRSFLHTLFNIIEDVVIEVLIDELFKTKFPSKTRPKVYFYHLKKHLFVPQADTYEDDGSIPSFINYLLLVLRLGKDKVKGSNEIYEKYVDGFKPLLIKALTTVDATERLNRVVELGEWMINNIKELDFTEVTIMETEKRSGTMSSSKKGKIKGEMGEGTMAPMTGDSVKGSLEKIGEKMEGRLGSSEKETTEAKEEKATTDKDSDSEGAEALDNIDTITEEGMKDLLEADDSDLIETDLHEWIQAKEEFDIDESVLDILDTQIHEFDDEINEVANLLKLIKDRTKPRRVGWFSSGHLNVRKHMNNQLHNIPSIKTFERKESRGKATDLAVWLVGDVSGSMNGIKSVLCSQAMLVLAQPCDWANIPFCSSVFTKTYDGNSGVSITITLKDFNENFESSKKYFAITNSELKKYVKSEKDIPLFSGNSEEVNLYYIWQEFRKLHHETKLLIVMCDGETTGSKRDLRNVINAIEKDGIGVIGIGIQCDTVGELYPKSKLFRSTTELKSGLPQFLIDTLTEYMLNK